MDDSNDTPDAAADDAKHLLETFLRQRFPLVGQEALLELATKCKDLISATIKEQQPLMATAKTRTSFLSLSAELRNQIYELALAPEELQPDSRLEDHYYNHTGERTFVLPLHLYFSRPPCLKDPSITRTNRQIRHEALSTMFGRFKFTICSHAAEGLDSVNWRSYLPLYGWLCNIGEEKARMIRELCFFFPNMDLTRSCAKEEILEVLRIERFGIAKEAVKVYFGNDCQELLEEG